MKIKNIGLIVFFGLLCGISSLASAANSGSVDFHLVGVLPTDSFVDRIDVEYETCDNSSGKVTLDKSSDWHAFGGAVRIDWSLDPTCQVKIHMDDNRNDVRYYGSASCNAMDGTTVLCNIHVCRQIDNGPPQC